MENELINTLTTMLITIPIITIFETKLLLKRERYKLIKRNKYSNFKIIHPAPQIKEIKKFKKNNVLNTEIKQTISYFINNLSKHLSENELKIIIHNIENLEFKDNSPLFFIMPYWGGFYKPKNHCIYITKIIDPKEELYKHILYHELLHSITTHKQNNIYYMGFYQAEHKSIGKMINEGYTELLTKRIFGDENIIGYKYEVAIAELIEYIVGKDKMKELYFKADLNGLINELAKYLDINKVKQLILNIDTIRLICHKKNSNYEGALLVNLYNQNSTMLYELFSNKRNQTTKIDNIDMYELESDNFLRLFNEINKYTAFEIEETNKKAKETEGYTQKDLTEDQFENNKEKIISSKKFVKTKNKGFINIITISTLMTIISLLSIGVSYLLLQAR